MGILQFSKAKMSLSDVFDGVERGRPCLVQRRKSPRIAFIRADELDELLRLHYPFHSEVSRGDDGTVSVWLHELDVYGRGTSLDAAIDDLLNEVEIYLDDWETSLKYAPNHSRRRWWVHRLQLADGRSELRTTIFDPPGAIT
ncbi:MAG: hypothetical protein WD576_01765 [Nitriliruptoraceae bacterium]